MLRMVRAVVVVVTVGALTFTGQPVGLGAPAYGLPPVAPAAPPGPADVRAPALAAPATVAAAGPYGCTTSRCVVVKHALAQVGKPYVWGAAGPNAFDCSGLALYAYARVGIRLPHDTYGQAGMGRPVARNALRYGDLVFPTPGHVQVYIGRTGAGGAERVVEAPKPGGAVKVSAVWGFAYARSLLP